MLESLDKDKWEADLVLGLYEMKEEILKHMTVTVDLTNEGRGTKKSAIEIEIGRLCVNVSLLYDFSFYIYVHWPRVTVVRALAHKYHFTHMICAQTLRSALKNYPT